MILNKKRRAEEDEEYRQEEEELKNEPVLNSDSKDEFLSRAKEASLRLKMALDSASIGALEQPAYLKAQLKPFQLEGYRWLISLFQSGIRGGILADEMGSGKTLQTIAFLLFYFGTERSQLSSISRVPSLILMPLSILSNWESEWTRFVSSDASIRLLTFHGNREQRHALLSQISSVDLVLMTFETMINSYEDLSAFNWDILVVDEAHRLKNSSSLLYRILSSMTFSMKILLTGTPIQNNLLELNNLLHFACPLIFPSDSSLFVDWFPISSSSASEKSMSIITELQNITRPFILRREKSEVIEDLPEMKEAVIYCGISALQKRLYKSLLKRDISSFHLNKKTSLSNTLVQLKKCANHPYIFSGIEPEPFEIGEHLVNVSGKLQILDKLLHFLKENGHRVLIFSQMTMMLDILQDYMQYRNYDYERLDGNVRAEERNIAVSHFSTENVFAFLLSTRAGGVGLNLTAADVVIFYDSDFNPQMDLQAASRVHRIGQTKDVTVIRLISRGTVEELIYRRAQSKRAITASILSKGAFSGHTKDPHDRKHVYPLGHFEFIESFFCQDLTDNLAHCLKFGLDKLMENEESTVTEEDFDQIFHVFSSGHSDTRLEVQDENMDIQTSHEKDSIYLYEGQDYSKISSADSDAFKKLEVFVVDDLTGPRKIMKPTSGSLDEEYAALEAARAERRKQHDQRRQAKIKELRERTGYVSYSLPDPSEDFSNDNLDSCEIIFARGSVTKPQSRTPVAIIVHCVDNSGKWSEHGVFRALNDLDPTISENYCLAKEMEDLHVGDAHLLPVESNSSANHSSKLYVCLIVAQKRIKNQPSAINFEHLKRGLSKLAVKAHELGASVHLSRIGQSTPQFDWYSTERIIKNCLCSHGIETWIYYFSSRRRSEPSSPAASSFKASECFSEIFSGLLFSFYSDLQNKKQQEYLRILIRYIAANGGEIVNFDAASSTKPSHLIVLQKDNLLTEIIHKCEECDIACVTPEWLIDSIISLAIQDPKYYKPKIK